MRPAPTRRHPLRLATAAAAALCACAGPAAGSPPPRSVAPLPVAPPALALARDVALLPGRFVPGEQPDGNTVVLRAPEGLVVVDAGRHAGHGQAILDLAARAGAPVAALVNTHWHLDHAGGDALLRRAFPAARLHASRAVEGALAGFLATYRGQLVEAMAATADAAARGRWQAEVDLIDGGAAMRPDEPIEAAGPRAIAGRPLVLGLARRAVTEADVWVLDPATGILAAGDLVTLPAPLLDTADPEGWRAALEALLAAPFTVLVPGHGPPMTRAEARTWADGYGRLLDCAASPRTDEACVQGWLDDLGPLVPPSQRDHAAALLGYYLPARLRRGPDR